MNPEASFAFEPHLLALSGQVKGQRFVLAGDFPIGRNVASVPLNDMSVSRQHCVIRKQDIGFVLMDLGSHNGTFVNGQPVSERLLEHGDQILIGDSEFLFVLSDDEIPAVSIDVQFVDQKIDPAKTVVLRAENSRYLQPEKALAQSIGDERTRRDLQALLKVATSVNGGNDGTGSFPRRLLNQVLEAIPADGAAILVTQRETAASLVAEGFKGCPRVSRTIVDRVLRDCTAMMTNFAGDRDAPPSLLAADIRSLLCVPLRLGDQAIGAIYLVRTTNSNDFDEGHLQLLTAIAAMVATPLDNARQAESLRVENRRLRMDIDAEHQMIGNSPAMNEVYRFLSRVAKTDSTVLIGGESGTGKELVARAIHRLSVRAQMPFIAVNCAAMTETLVESELFGHEKGAFTGAVAQTKGKFESAEGGTIFLDEVGELPLATQSKLLRVLQERELNRVGNSRTIKVNARVLAATNRDLETDIHDGRFRKDLYYRLNVVAITLPPLRQRREDIIPLAEYFVAKSNTRCNRRVREISPDAAACLAHYDWPGNIRELENTIERAVVLGASDTILLEDLPEMLLESNSTARSTNHSGFHDAVRKNKMEIIQRALDKCDGNHVEAAKLLGLNRTYLHRLIRTLGM
jgi:Nif-specific regulatory protein